MFLDPLPWRRVASALLFGAATLHQAHATEPLSLAAALRLAQERSRQLPAHDAATAAARDMAVAAAQRPDPVLKAGINNLPLDGADRFSLTRDFMTMRSVGVMQELTRTDKLKARAARFHREAQASQADRELALASLQRDTAVAWLERHFQERMREVLARLRDEARLQIDAADAAYRGGRGSPADVFAARSSVAQIEDRIAQTGRQIATATTQLARWVGAPATAPLGSPEPLDTVRLRAEGLEAVLEHHPQIASMARREEVGQAEAEVARTERTPDWTVELMFNQRGPAYSTMVSVNVSVPLPLNRRDRQDRELSAKLAAAQRLRAEREEAARAHTAEVLTMLQEWRSHRERLSRYDASLIPLAADRTQAAVAAYRGGAGPLGAVLESRRNEIDVQMDRLRLQMDAARLWAQLNYLIPRMHEQGAPR